MDSYSLSKLKSLSLFLVVLLLVLTDGSVGFAAKLDRISPTAPGNINIVNVTYNTVNLTWTASTDNVGVKSYDVYCNGSLKGTVASTAFTASSLAAGTTYQFYVKAKDARGNLSGASSIVSTTTLARPAVSMAKIIGYYAAWSSYQGFTPNQIDATKLTHIQYAFANITPDLKVTLGYPDVDSANIKQLQALKLNNPSLKTLISIGGWTWSGRFSDAALTEASRTAFADSAVSFMKQYGFDGIDLDWEYPVSGGLSTNVRRPEDKQNFTLLLQKLREKLDAQGALDQKHYLLAIAGGASTGYIGNVEMAKIHSYLDYASIMTYDLHGTWDAYTDFHAPLYSNTDPSPQYKWSADQAVNAWLAASFPKEKLVMGIPFYGYLYSSVTDQNQGLYQRFAGANSVSYAQIKKQYLDQPGYHRYFHPQSLVPWLFNGSVFISYEDPQSIQAKTAYLKQKALAGAMIWELSQDDNHTLLDAINQGLQ